MNLRKQLRKESAIKRHTEFNSLTTIQKIALLNIRLGENIGATKQRAKLQRILELKEEIKISEVKEKNSKPYSKPKKS